MLGALGFAGQIPIFLLAPFAGVWVDRLNRYHLLLATQLLAMLQSLALAALARSGAIAVWHILALQFAQGLINSFDMPSRQSASGAAAPSWRPWRRRVVSGHYWRTNEQVGTQ